MTRTVRFSHKKFFSTYAKLANIESVRPCRQASQSPNKPLSTHETPFTCPPVLRILELYCLRHRARSIRHGRSRFCGQEPAMDSGNATFLRRNDVPVRGGKVCSTSSGDKECFLDRAPIWPEAKDGSRSEPQTDPQDLGHEIGGASRKRFESLRLRRVERVGPVSRIPASSAWHRVWLDRISAMLPGNQI